MEKLAEEPDPTWIEDLAHEHLPAGDRKPALKDAHLVATATDAADRRLLSGDGAARDKFARLAPRDARLQGLHWVDPSWDGVRQWLLQRAPPRAAWMLGAPP